MTRKLGAPSIMVEEGRLDHQVTKVIYRIQGLPERLVISCVPAEYEARPATIQLIGHSWNRMAHRQRRDPPARQLYRIAYRNRAEPHIRFAGGRQRCIIRSELEIEHILLEYSNGFGQGVNSKRCITAGPYRVRQHG